MSQDVAMKLAMMKAVAQTKVAKAHGAPMFFQEVERNLDLIATAKLSDMAPVNENLLGMALMLLEEVKRLRANGG